MLEKNIYNYILLILVISCNSKYIEEINNICKKTNIKYISSYKTEKEFFENINYDFNNEKNVSEIYDKLLENQLVEFEEFEYFYIIKDYLMNLFIIPIIFLWIIFIILVFRKKFIFNVSFHFEFISKFYQKVFMIIIFFLVFILSLIIFGKLKDLNSSINSAFCNLLKFFYELNHGKIKEKDINDNYMKSTNNISSIDKGDLWPGLYDLNSILLDSAEAINKISYNENKTFSLLEEININIKDYENNINSLMQTASKKIPNPNYYLNNDILTRYSYEFLDTKRNNTYINIINTEFNNYFKKSTELFKSLNKYCIALSKKNDFYDNELDNFFENISDFSSLMKDTSKLVTNNIIIYQDHFETIIFIIKILNIFSLIFSLIAIIFIVLHFYKNYIWIKRILSLCWNLGFILMAFYCCVFYYINNLGKIAEDFLFIINKEILNTNTSLFFNKCFNTEDSDLKELLYIYDVNSVLIDIDRYYKNIYPIFDALNNLEKEIPKLDNIKNISNSFNIYLNNYELSTNSSYNNSDIIFVLNEITKITKNDFEEKNNLNDKCESNDIWVLTKNKCKDYKYISIYELENKFKRKKEEKYCFIIKDNYEESDLKEIYKNICAEKAYDKLVNYILGLTKYFNSNENLLNNLQQILKEIERYNKKLTGLILEQINNCQNDISDLIDIYNPILRSINVTNLFKCGGLKRKIINFYDIGYNQIIYTCKYIEVDTLALIIFIFFGNLLIVVNNKEKIEIRRKYLKMENKDLNNDGVELIEEVPDEDEDI